ncbi:DUF2570 domain-containing protein [Yersinia sp. 2544 StPb PI]|uniref:DUF2570 domain-containing protein n=1 Tax=unclassified Yersinia (in: enterobacteria) TaxID=2653513 RepID=UPI0009F5D05E|nr:DUF2570 domain-containing protein [Yersinia enterocolitica]
MILPISKMYSIGLFLAILLVCVLWIRYQQRAYNQIQQDNKQFKMQNGLLNNRLLQLKSQAENLAFVITRQAQNQTELETKNDLFRQKTRTALAKNSLANQPVPVDVIRLQRELIEPK